LEKRKILYLLQFETWDHPDGETDTVQHTTTLQLPKYHPKTGLCRVTTLKETLHPLCRKQGQPQSQSELVQKI